MPAPPPLRFGTFGEIAQRLADRIATTLLALPPAERLRSRPDLPDLIVSSAAFGREIARRAAAKVPGGLARPVIYTLESFARSLLAGAPGPLRTATDNERRLTMRAAVQSFDDELLETRGVVSMLERSYRDLRDSGWSVDRLEKSVRIDPVRNRDRVRLVVRIWRQYEKLSAASGALDPADLFARASTAIVEMPHLPMYVVAGFYDMTGVQLALISALHRRGRLDSFDASVDARGSSDAEREPGSRFGQRFIDRLTAGLVFAMDGQEGGSARRKRPAFDAVQYSAPDEELHAICDSVRRLLDHGVAASSIAIASRAIDAGDAELLRHLSSRAGFALSDRTSRPLRGHRFGRALSIVLNLRHRAFPRGDVIEILRCGFRPIIAVDAARLDQATRAAGIAGGMVEMLRSAKRPERYQADIDKYATVVADLERMTAPGGAPLAAPAWGDLLDAVMSHFRPETTADLEAAAEIDALIATLHHLNGLRQRFDAPAILDLIERATLSTAGSTDPVVWLGDVMQARGRHFEHLFLIRMEEDLFPQRRVEDPLLPDSDRRTLGLPQVGDGRDEERFLFETLLSSAETVHFSLAATDGFARPVRPSPLLRQFLIDSLPGSRREILHDLGAFLRSRAAAVAPHVREDAVPPTTTSTQGARGPWLLRQMQRALSAGTRSTFDGYLSRVPALQAKIAATLGSLSPTQLEEFGECPQRFLFKSILGVREVADPGDEPEIGHREKGNIDHRILETFYGRLRQSDIDEGAARLPVLAPFLAQRLDEAIDETFRDFAAVNPAWNAVIRDLEIGMTRKNLRRFVARDLTDLRSLGLTPRWFEYRFGSRARAPRDHPDSFHLTVADVVLSVDGIIDRIDEGNGRLRIVDYKAGKGKKYEKLADQVGRGTRLQLALYAMAARAIFGSETHHPEIIATIKPLRAEGKAELFTFSLDQIEPSVNSTLELFVRSMIGGVFPALPDAGQFGHCLYCPVGQSCRSRHDPSESYELAQYEDARHLLEEISGA